MQNLFPINYVFAFKTNKKKSTILSGKRSDDNFSCGNNHHIIEKNFKHINIRNIKV